MSNWTPEPWSSPLSKTVTIDSDDYDRARACVNALADIDDPEAFVRQAKAAIAFEALSTASEPCAETVSRPFAPLERNPNA